MKSKPLSPPHFITQKIIQLNPHNVVVLRVSPSVVRSSSSIGPVSPGMSCPGLVSLFATANI